MSEPEVLPSWIPAKPKKSTMIVLGVASYLLAVILGAVTALLGVVALGFSPMMPAGKGDFSPVLDQSLTSAEKALFKKLRQPTVFEAQTMFYALSEAKRDLLFAPGYMAIATEDLVLPSEPLPKAIYIGLPGGIKWLDGPLNNVTLVFASAGESNVALGLFDGKVMYDALCYPNIEAEDLIDPAACKDREPARPGAYEQYRAGNEARKLRSFVEYEWEKARSFDPYVAGQPLRLDPNWVDSGQFPVVLLQPGGRIVGGQLGRTQVIAPRPSGPGVILLEDPVYMNALYNSPDVCPHLGQPVRQRHHACM